MMIKYFSFCVLYFFRSEMFNYSLTTEILPSTRVQHSLSIRKGASKHLPNDYCLFPLTCIKYKVLEHVMSSITCVQTVSIFDDSQLGFRPRKSCKNQLAHAIGCILHLYDLGINVDLLFF